MYEPLGDGPGTPPPMEEEIERHVADFAQLGMNAHSTVAMWLGKPNRFTGIVMSSALEVLEYVRTELNQTMQIQAEVKAAATGTDTHAPAQALQAGVGDAHTGTAVVTQATESSDPGARIAAQARKDLVYAASFAWREAVRQRKEAIAQWDIYVSLKREEYKRAKMLKV